MKVRIALTALIAGTLMASAAHAESTLVGTLPTTGTDTFETTFSNPSPGVEVLSGFGPDSIIFGFKVYPTASNGFCALYDTATSTVSPATTQGVFIDEGGGATALVPYISSWPSPYRLTTGLLVQCLGARAVIYHGKK